ncbi:hypothetical protein TNCT_125461 [Trichonephila clavata]|uniref:Uncharacterized protein n=1 Tax=Trichonephila clavata TaxID=2740835 RepID=A0A8X6KIF4_TRICU|nr:hypothetical protein TNCT_125461 [Trichonephila clavata]
MKSRSLPVTIYHLDVNVAVEIGLVLFEIHTHPKGHQMLPPRERSPAINNRGLRAVTLPDLPLPLVDTPHFDLILFTYTGGPRSPQQVIGTLRHTTLERIQETVRHFSP